MVLQNRGTTTTGGINDVVVVVVTTVTFVLIVFVCGLLKIFIGRSKRITISTQKDAVITRDLSKKTRTVNARSYRKSHENDEANIRPISYDNHVAIDVNAIEARMKKMNKRISFYRPNTKLQNIEQYTSVSSPGQMTEENTPVDRSDNKKQIVSNFGWVSIITNGAIDFNEEVDVTTADSYFGTCEGHTGVLNAISTAQLIMTQDKDKLEKPKPDQSISIATETMTITHINNTYTEPKRDDRFRTSGCEATTKAWMIESFEKKQMR